MGDEPRRARQGPTCPICGRPTEPACRPFCSAHCRDQDLLNWLRGRYAIPAHEVDPDDDESGTDQSG